MKINWHMPGMKRTEVFLNGELVQACVIEADSEAGYVLIPSLVEASHSCAAITHPDYPKVLQFNGILVEVLTGKVELRPKSGT